VVDPRYEPPDVEGCRKCCDKEDYGDDEYGSGHGERVLCVCALFYVHELAISNSTSA